ncbi:hypothetical protein BBO99_00006086 [Phytophthora kernoviae]|uniref:FYVE-type domain-containing protein n=2 Tax=Phytophthora kernoviae TaxID=325452 RepID=A0A421ES66_9STRA|nr:hypothetical protein G195_007526 [Phytophthora kernoviae 00238/432]KAG2522305.1 hypothetical protein JM16_005794 [Phytophthora kernoviae]KAG2523932.1 hypothetical protein JM18_005588 [Phytophthora kernoviae]RLM95721.1 hypothetical protein BBI17_006154 [Phytophthora kernoviae]RLN78257.1 hypothetical protein BBO99_00006086 [Phytophthora kernoviae]
MPKLYSTNDKKLYHALTETFHGSMYLDDDDSEDELSGGLSFVSSELNVLDKLRPPRATLVFSAGIVPADDTRTLCCLHGPTHDDPFRFLGITWNSHVATGFAGRFINPRDYVILTSTGMALDSRGERFFYLLKHSIELDEVPDFESFGSCTVTKTEVAIAKERIEDELAFCLNCYLKGKKLSAWQNELEKSIPADVPMVFCTGIVPGTIEDAALGFFADTEARSRMRNSNTKDMVVDDVRILAQIHGPTEDDPFRFLGIKWCAHSTAGAAGHFIKSRDYVIIESTGMALDARGNRFCYMLNHSIELHEVPDFREFGHVRMTFSACHIMRPCNTVGQIEIFSRGFMDTRGIIAERLCTYMYCDGLMSVPLAIEEAYAKKLTWLLHAQQSNDSWGLCPPLDMSDSCRCCKSKLLTGFAKLLESNWMCFLCKHTICRKCTVKKELTLDANGPTKQVVEFCVSCYLEGKNLSAWQVGIAMLSASRIETTQDQEQFQ